MFNLNNKLISYYDINNNQSTEYDFKDLISNNHGTIEGFTKTTYDNDEDMKYINFSNINNYIQIPTIDNIQIKSLAFTIKLNDLKSGTIISSKNLYIFNKYTNIMQSLINNQQLSANIEESVILNNRITMYIDIVNRKFYINNIDVTRITSIGGWSHDTCTGILIGKSYYSSFIGKLYDLSFFNEVLDDTERELLFNKKNKLIIENNYLLKENDTYYSIKNEYYNNNKYQSISISNNIPSKEEIKTYGFKNLNELIQDTTINNETFKPIDKFNNFKIITDNPKEINITAIKTNKELIISNNNFSTRISSNIDYFKLEDSSNDIKIIFSIDDGITWKSYKDNNFINLNINIPNNKSYKDFTVDEKNKWNEAIDIVEQSGISIDSLLYIDFNKLNITNIRFGYLLFANNKDTISHMKQLIWQFDSKGSVKLCDNNEISVELYYGGLKVIPNISCDMIKTNITYEGISDNV